MLLRSIMTRGTASPSRSSTSALKSSLGQPRTSLPLEAPLTLRYRDITLQHTFAPDFICFEKIILEIKAVETLSDKHRSQVVNYLHAASYDLGLLVNFGAYPRLQHERLVHSRHLKTSVRTAWTSRL